jgi:hypothetical protein
VKRMLTLALALAFVVLAVPIHGTTTIKSTKSNASLRVTVTNVNPENHTFTGTADGKELTFDAKNLTTSPVVGDVIDIKYTQTTGGPMVATATTVHGSKSNSSYREGAPTSAPTVITGTVTKVNPDNTFTVTANGQELTVDAKIEPANGSASKISMEWETQCCAVSSECCREIKVIAKVLSVDAKNKTFTVESNHQTIVFTVINTSDLPPVAKIVDIILHQTTPGGPFTVTTINSSKSNTF